MHQPIKTSRQHEQPTGNKLKIKPSMTPSIDIIDDKLCFRQQAASRQFYRLYVALQSVGKCCFARCEVFGCNTSSGHCTALHSPQRSIPSLATSISSTLA